MSARYGSRTRSGEAVSDLGRRGEAGGGAFAYYEEKFTAPGTWSWPGNVSFVEVFVVGGGGGGGGGITGPYTLGGGGGGGYVVEWQGVPVSAPVPVTVGSGGPAGSPSPYVGGTGGTSHFGPLGPGPVPSIPPTTVYAGGGGGGGGNGNVGAAGPIYGGGGGGGSYTPAVGWRNGANGTRGAGAGTPAEPSGIIGGSGGGARVSATQNAYNGYPGPAGDGYVGPMGAFGGGGAGGYAATWQPTDGTPSTFPAITCVGTGWGSDGMNGTPRPNTGGGGAGIYYQSGYPDIGQAGFSGVVFVRWYE